MDTFKNLISKIAQSLGIGNEQTTQQQSSPVQPQAFDINNVDFSNIQPIAEQPIIQNIPSPVAPQTFDVNQIDFSNIQPIVEEQAQPLFDLSNILPSQLDQPVLFDQQPVVQDATIGDIVSPLETPAPFDIGNVDFSNIQPIVEDAPQQEESILSDIPKAINDTIEGTIDMADSLFNAGASAVSSPENINFIANVFTLGALTDDGLTGNEFSSIGGLDKPNKIVADIFPEIREGAKAKQKLNDLGYDVSRINTDDIVASLNKTIPTKENFASLTNEIYGTNFTNAEEATKFQNTLLTYRKTEQNIKTPLYIPPTGYSKNTIQYDNVNQELQNIVKKGFANPDLTANQKAYLLQVPQIAQSQFQTIASYQNKGIETPETSKYWERLFKGTADMALLNGYVAGKVRGGMSKRDAQVEEYKRYMGKDYVEGSENLSIINDSNLTNAVFRKAFAGIPRDDQDRTVKQIASRIKLMELKGESSLVGVTDRAATSVGLFIDEQITPLAGYLGLGVRSLGSSSYKYNLNDILGTTDAQLNTSRLDSAGNFVSEYGAGFAKFVGSTVATAGLGTAAGLASSRIPGAFKIGQGVSSASRYSKIISPIIIEVAENIPFYFTYGSTFGDNLSKENLQMDGIASLLVGGFGAMTAFTKANKYHSTVFNNIANMQKDTGNQFIRGVTDFLQSKGIPHEDTAILTQYALDTMDALTKTPEGQNQVMKLRANQDFADKAKTILGVNTIDEYNQQYGDINQMKREYVAMEGKGMDVERAALGDRIARNTQVQTLANTYGTRLQEIFAVEGMDNKMIAFAVMANSPQMYGPNGSLTVKKPIPQEDTTLFDIDNSGTVSAQQYEEAKPKADALGIELDTILKKNDIDGTYTVPTLTNKTEIAKMALVDSSIAKTMLVYNIIENGCL